MGIERDREKEELPAVYVNMQENRNKLAATEEILLMLTASCRGVPFLPFCENSLWISEFLRTRSHNGFRVPKNENPRGFQILRNGIRNWHSRLELTNSQVTHFLLR
jgi:hypothetical protein